MDQLKQVGEFLWKWRFWFCLGIALILAVVVQPVGTARVQMQVEARKRQLDGALQQIQRYTSGVHPNPTWEEKVKEKQVEADKRVTDIQLEIYNKQAQRLVWPEIVAKEFNGRPFNTPLDDDNGRYLFLYYRNFDEFQKELRKVIEPVTINRDGTVTGKVMMAESALERPTWTKDPDSQTVWLAQEQMWIQQAVLEGIARVNKNAKTWYDAPIREVLAIRLGSGAVDGKKAAELGAEVKLQPPPPLEGAAPAAGPPAAGGGGAQENSGNIKERYLEITPDSRTVPIQMALLADPLQLPNILAELSTIDFAFVIKEVSWFAPSQRVQTPAAVEDYFDVASADQKKAEENTVQLFIYGEMFIYDMPADMKQKWFDQRNAAQNPSAAPPAPAPE